MISISHREYDKRDYMTKKNVLFINGVPDNRRARLREINKDGVFRWGSTGSANLSS